MKRYLASAAVLALLATTSAMAQNPFDQHRGRGGPLGSGGQPQEMGQPRGPSGNDLGTQAPPIAGSDQTMPDHDRDHVDRNTANGGWRGNIGAGQSTKPAGAPNTTSMGPPNGWQGYQPSHRRYGGQAHFDVRAFQKNIQSPQRFHAGAYNPPRGWYPHRWRYGEYLPRFFFVSDYWITDFWDFGLFAPPPGFVWVRVGDDALLIDEYTGEIVEVVYEVFW